jgi:hypothetical protein
LGRNALMEKQFDAVLVPKVSEACGILTRAQQNSSKPPCARVELGFVEIVRGWTQSDGEETR